MAVAIVVALLAIWAAFVAYEMRQAVRASDLEVRRRRAQRLLAVVSVGIPLVLALLIVA